VFTLLRILSANFSVIMSCSALGGSHGVPRVHFKGRQGDYYIMVCTHEYLVDGWRLLVVSKCFYNYTLLTGHGYAWS